MPGIVAFSTTGIPAVTNFPLALPVDATPTISLLKSPLTVILLINIEHFFSFVQFSISLAAGLCKETSSVRYEEKTATFSSLLMKIRVG